MRCNDNVSTISCHTAQAKFLFFQPIFNNITYSCLLILTVVQNLVRSNQLNVSLFVIQHHRVPTVMDRIPYRAQCRISHKLIEDLLREHNRKQVSEADNGSRQQWQQIKKLLHPSSSEMHTPAISDPETFMEFFWQKVIKIRDNLRLVCGLQLPVDPLQSDLPHTGELWQKSSEVTVEEVRKVISSLPSKTSPLDVFPTSILKSCVDVFSPIIATLANKSLTQGCFPSIFKSAQITPLLKKKGLDEDKPCNYRPISNLSTISKILEKLFLVRLNDHLSRSSNRNAKQSAYRSHHSTETALQSIFNDIYRDIDRKRVSLLVALDISAAFDTLEHGTLLRRLQNTFGITGAMLEWVRSYLSDRNQFVKILGSCSRARIGDSGVPQGSVLGPVLFTLFVSPVARVIENAGLLHHQYADDTQLYVSFMHGDEQLSTVLIEGVTDKVRDWFRQNGLQLNPDKSEAMLLGTRQRLATIELPSINIAGSPIELVPSLKSLGVTIDSGLTFDRHINNICRASYFNIRALRQIRSALTRETARSVAASLVQTRLDYCNSILVGTTVKNLSKLQRVQNSLARVVTGHRKREHITPVLMNLHWLRVEDRIKYKLCCLTFKAKNLKQPAYLADLIQPYQPGRLLRSAAYDNLAVPTGIRTDIASRAFSVAGPTIWNTLPDQIKQCDNISRFRKNLKTHFYKLSYKT